MIQKSFIPHVVYHPGATLQEKLEELGMSAKEFSVRTKKPEKTINAVIKGNSSLTPDMAVAFESVTRIPAHFWMQKQQKYNEYVARQKREKTLEDSVEWSKQFPLTEMVKRGWLKPEDNTSRAKVLSIFSYFAVSSKEAWEDYYFNQQLKVAFRISLSQTKNPYAVSAWLRRGELQAALHTCEGEYSLELLRKTIPEMKCLILDETHDMPLKLQTVCSKCGIKLIYTECLPKAPISGATRWIQNVPCIQLSGRYKTRDRFWFNFFHEVGHIVLHGKKNIFLEDIDYSTCQKDKEEAADKFASDILLNSKQEQKLTSIPHFTKEIVLELADEFKTSPAIIVGRLQHKKLISYRIMNDLKTNVELNYR